ncbi:MAG: DNA alkylation repair protein [Pseudomonadales bacterium]
MAEPLKHVYSQDFIRDLGERVASHSSHFNVTRFTQDVLAQDWPELELKARMSRISATLHQHLPSDFTSNATLLGQVAESYLQAGRSGFEYMFLPEYIAEHGLSEFRTAMQALGKITQTGSAEFAVRPFLITHEAKSLRQMQRWAGHRNHHLRRLASEGTRPRLPWAMALPQYKADPTPILPILELLKADDSDYVRRSVANNLNDISKDHPELTLDIAAKWQGQGQATDRLIKHACRGLLKAGHPRALALFGLEPPAHIKLINFGVENTAVKFGDALAFTFQLQSQKPLGLVRLEYAIDFLKANGAHSRKVFKISETDHKVNTITLSKRHKFVPITTRKHYPGPHGVAIIVNGVELAAEQFQLHM